MLDLTKQSQGESNILIALMCDFTWVKVLCATVGTSLFLRARDCTSRSSCYRWLRHVVFLGRLCRPFRFNTVDLARAVYRRCYPTGAMGTGGTSDTHTERVKQKHAQ